MCTTFDCLCHTALDDSRTAQFVGYHNFYYFVQNDYLAAVFRRVFRKNICANWPVQESSNGCLYCCYCCRYCCSCWCYTCKTDRWLMGSDRSNRHMCWRTSLSDSSTDLNIRWYLAHTDNKRARSVLHWMVVHLSLSPTTVQSTLANRHFISCSVFFSFPVFYRYFNREQL